MAAAGFLSRYLSGPIPYNRNKMCCCKEKCVAEVVGFFFKCTCHKASGFKNSSAMPKISNYILTSLKYTGIDIRPT